MAHLPRISDSKSGDSYLKHKVAQVNAILGRAEKMLGLAGEYERQGVVNSAKILQKRARDKAKIAMKLMGVLVWHHGVEMTPQIVKARNISHNFRSSGTNGTPQLPAQSQQVKHA
jgi:hypothetical protein